MMPRDLDSKNSNPETPNGFDIFNGFELRCLRPFLSGEPCELWQLGGFGSMNAFGVESGPKLSLFSCKIVTVIFVPFTKRLGNESVRSTAKTEVYP